MELTGFNCHLGEGQGRIQPQNAKPASGQYVFVLGDDQPGRFYDITHGDYAEIVQDVDLTEIDLLRVHLQLRVPDSLPAGFTWEVAIIVDGEKQAQATCKPGRTRTLTDLAANVSKVQGIHSVGIRLELRRNYD